MNFNPKRKRVVFGMDGGLPARVAASILRNQDFDLLAVHLRCDLEKIGEDPALYPSAMQSSALPEIEKFCESLGVPLKVIDVTEETLAKVYTPFWIATLTGTRFSGSSAWARDILFPHLDAVAQTRGATLLATGHFARHVPDLCRYTEEFFDQSRTLARLDRAILEKLILPVGDVSVEMLMRLAREVGATPKDGEGFSLDRETATLVDSRAARGIWEWTDEQLADSRVHARASGEYFQPGPLRGEEEFAVDEHRGIPYFKVGYRSPQYTAHFVQTIIPQSRTLVVTPESGLRVDGMIVRDLVWNDSESPSTHRQRRIIVEKEPPNRRLQKLGPARAMGSLLEYPGHIAEIRLESPLFGVGPGELLVFFEESRILGSAIVAEVDHGTPAEKAIENRAPPA